MPILSAAIQMRCSNNTKYNNTLNSVSVKTLLFICDDYLEQVRF